MPIAAERQGGKISVMCFRTCEGNHSTEEGIGMQLPKTFRFLNPGWFVVHLVAIPLVFYLGHLLW